MQVSTRTCDYIIDTLELRHCMQEMNVVFTDPSIVKVSVYCIVSIGMLCGCRYFMELTGISPGFNETLPFML